MNIKKILIIAFIMVDITGCAINNNDFTNLQYSNPKQILQKGNKALANKDYYNAIKYFKALNLLCPLSSEEEEKVKLNIIKSY